MRIKSKIANHVRRRRLEMESAVYDSAMDLVNPAEAYLDPQTGEMWTPLGISSDVDFNAAPYRNDAELKLIRQRARITALKNPYAKNLLNSICSIAIGKGHKYSVTVKKDIKDPKDRIYAAQCSRKFQRWLDNLLKMNKWGKRQFQTVWRFHRDGETFTRLFFQENGYTLFRFCEPAEIITPPEYSADPSAAFGIKTEEDDVESVEAYFVAGEKVAAEEIQHRKANVDLNQRRGLSTLFTIREHLDRALKLLRNMSITVANQTAMTMIRHHKATGKQVSSFAAKAAMATRYNAATQRDQRQASLPPGAVVDVVDGKTRYEFPANGLNAASPVQVLAAELRAIASSMSWPEFMIGSDAANANYSSTMVAENPAVKSIETEQQSHIDDDLELIWAAAEHAVNVGKLPEECMSMVEIEVEAPIIITRNIKDQADVDEILNRIRVKSPRSIASSFNLDYDQEQQNFSEHDDTTLDNGAIDNPISGNDLPAGADDVAKTALNGAQVTALVDICQRAAAGAIPLESVGAIIAASFPGLDTAIISKIVDPLVNFKASPAALKLAA